MKMYFGRKKNDIILEQRSSILFSDNCPRRWMVSRKNKILVKSKHKLLIIKISELSLAFCISYESFNSTTLCDTLVYHFGLSFPICKKFVWISKLVMSSYVLKWRYYNTTILLLVFFPSLVFESVGRRFLFKSRTGTGDFWCGHKKIAFSKSLIWCSNFSNEQ